MHGVRVLDHTSGIAGPYCSKVLADAGADVVKVESAAGDELRQWRSGGLFEYLNASKRSVTDGHELEGRADLLMTGDPDQAAAWHKLFPHALVLSISPFGHGGPWAGRPATEYTLQAACGSLGGRGLPEEPPLAVGGRVGEWITGTYAALAAVAFTGTGRLVDVAMFDCMAVTLVTYPSVFASFSGWPPVQGTGRTVEVPSIEPTSDGYAVFTTNSAQQFQDFCVLIGRPDWQDDPELARAPERFLRRNEFLAATRAWSRARSSKEALDEAALWRIPCGPVLDGSTVADFEQFQARGVYRRSPSGRFRQPRPPYRIGGVDPTQPRAAPRAGEHEGEVDWPTRPRTAGSSEVKPLAGIRVLDCTGWWAGPAATFALAALGADVVKVESVKRPDPMRMSSTRPPSEEGWWEWGPLFHAVNAGKRGVTIDLSRPVGVELFERLAATADVVVENFTPRVMEQFGLGWDRLHEVNPQLVMVRMPAFGLDGPWRDRTGFAQTMECISGLAWLTGRPDGSPVLPRGVCDPVAGMHAALATVLALRARQSDGNGRLVESTMVEAALNIAAEQVIEWDTSATLLGRGDPGPQYHQDVHSGAGDDEWVAVSVDSVTQWQRLSQLVGPGGLAAWCSERSGQEAADLLLAAGVAAAPVVASRDIAFNAQLGHRHLFEVEDHRVTGRHELPGLPFRVTGVHAWIGGPAPTLGQHNGEVLGEVATAEELESLRRAGVIGERLGS